MVFNRPTRVLLEWLTSFRNPEGSTENRQTFEEALDEKMLDPLVRYVL